MKEHDKDYLRALFQELPDVERRRLMKKAAKNKKKADRGLDVGMASHRIPRNKKRGGRTSSSQKKSVEEWALVLLAEEMVEADEKIYEGDGSRGMVVSIYPAWCDVRIHETGETHLCHLVGELARSQKTLLAVGDEVIAYPADDSRWVVTSVLPRTTYLSRPDPHDPGLERVIVANIEVVCAVISVKQPALHPRVLDRLWLAIQRGGAKPIVAVNKIDLLDADEFEEVDALLDAYRDAGLEFHYVSAATGEGIEQLRAAVSGTVCTFIGHSGVGKSSIINRVFPEVTAVTGSVRGSDGRGRHTTTRSTLYLGDDGTRLIDTPGIRSFGLWDMTAEEVRGFFDEFTQYAPSCRFPDCSHVHEPGCAVIEAVENGEIASYRYDTYVRLLEEDF